VCQKCVCPLYVPRPADAERTIGHS
jgi:hypothetical protein